jgi:NAD-dependent dihydropyrimidine dehydrogenase PreA subunit
MCPSVHYELYQADKAQLKLRRWKTYQKTQPGLYLYKGIQKVTGGTSMHHELTKALYDVFTLENKSDFFPIYLYLKYIDHFIYHAFLSSGLPAKKPQGKLDDSIEEMLKYYVQLIADTAASTETNVYHGKVLKLEEAIQLVTLKRDVSLSLPERVLPFKVARDIVLKSNDSISVGTCVCRLVSENPCLPPPHEVCLFVGDPFASFIAENNRMFRKISQDEAVKILEFAHQKGFVHTAYFKKETANRFMAICNCCSCCCVGIRMWNLLQGAVPIMAPSGYVSEVSEECTGCGTCIEVCNFKALTFDEGGEKVVVDLKKCMGCGICEDVCPIKAITLRREPSKGDPLNLEEILRQVSH